MSPQIIFLRARHVVHHLLSQAPLLVALLAVLPFTPVKASPPGTSAPSTAPSADMEMTALKEAFRSPPGSARPWVYWFWLNSNVSKESITADLEAMKRVGIGGVLLMDVNQGTPAGPVKFMDADWLELFKFTVQEANRLGLEINMNNGIGYFGSGGPWIPKEKGLQTVVASETHLTGGSVWTGALSKPVSSGDYRDITVLAVREAPVPKAQRYKIPNFAFKALYWHGWVDYTGISTEPVPPSPAPPSCIDLATEVDLTSAMKPDGTLTWNAPEGDWTILRMGHAFSGSQIEPGLPGQTGPCLDQMDASATELHFSAMVKKLRDFVGSEEGRSFVSTHIDSWEGGGQNWTPAMRAEFTKRRGYDPLPYLPILTERVVGNLDVTERFLWDLRQTVSELIVENYISRFQKLAHENHLRLSFECYTTGGNDLDQANYVDEPMAEFWTTGNSFLPTTKSMASAAHLNGHAIVGAEAFTSNQTEKWQMYPATIKALGDRAFCNGVNRFVIHRYAAQRFLNVVPGLQMGPWGLHYERTNTWWDWTLPWHAYLARCQQMLRQGQFYADILALQPEEPLNRFKEMPRNGFDYDACSPETFKRATVQDGKIVMPGAGSYRLLVLPKTEKMTLERMQFLTQLVNEGAAILGEPPKTTPGLCNFEKADAELAKMATALWGDDPSTPQRTVGKGTVFRGINPEQALARLGVAPDFVSDAPLNWIHRKLPGVNETNIYFVANGSDKPVLATGTFRVTGQVPECWNPVTGEITPLHCFDRSKPGVTSLSLSLEPSGSVFVVFRSAGQEDGQPLISVTRDGKPVVQEGRAVEHSPEDLSIDPERGVLLKSGTYSWTSEDRKTGSLTVPPTLDPLNVVGPWTVHFTPVGGAPESIVFDNLTSWNVNPNEGIRFFSGTATYEKKIVLTAEQIQQHRVVLDLGKVKVMAQVKCNGRDLGILWKPPYRVELTEAATVGENELEVRVVNLWPNRLIGDENLPEDSDRNLDGKKAPTTLKEWPEWLLQGKPVPNGRTTFCSWLQWHQNDALLESGLLGPVTVSFLPASDLKLGP